MKNNIKLIALDLDGTFVDEKKQISKENEQAVRAAVQKGIYVIFSTGRSLSAVPLEDAKNMGISYVITANGSQIHKLPETESIYSDGMEPGYACEIIRKTKELKVHTSVFINGECYADLCDYERVSMLRLDDVMKNYMRRTRTYVEDLESLVKEKNEKVQKFTLQFQYLDGAYLNYNEAYELLSKDDRICLVCGGYHNLEFSKQGITKGNSLRYLADLLGIELSQTMACGDTQNDLDIIQTAGLGVAMGNSVKDVKVAADFVTLSNEESGVAYAIQKLVLNED